MADTGPDRVIEVRCSRCWFPTWIPAQDKGDGAIICANCAFTERERAAEANDR